MKKTRNVLMLAALVSISILVSCGGGGGGPGKTDGEKLIEALVNGDWVIDASSTSVSSVTGTFDVNSFGIVFTASGSTVTYALDGDVETYLTGGTFTVSDEADIESPTVNTASSELTANVTSLNATEAEVEIVVSVTESNARETGIGIYTLVYNL